MYITMQAHFYLPVFYIRVMATENKHMNTLTKAAASAAISARLKAVYARRRSRLTQLLNDRFNENQSRMADEIGMNAGELSQLLLGKRAFGEKKARRMEVLLKTYPEWLDGAEPITGDDAVAERFRYVFRHAAPEGRGLLHVAIETVNNNYVRADRRLSPENTT